MEVTDDIDVIYEGTKELPESLCTAASALPEDKDTVALVEESMTDNCLRDTDGSLSSLNVDFFNDFHDPPKPAKDRRKKTMEKRKEERISFKHVDKATASDIEDDVDFSSMSSFTSVDSDFSPPALERKEIDDRFFEYRFRDNTVRSKRKDTKGINTVKGRKSVYSKKLPKMKRIYPEVKKDVLTASTSRGYNLSNLNKAVLPLKSDEGKQSKSETKEDFVILTTGEHGIVSNVDKRILLSPKRDEEEKSESYNEFHNMEIANNVIEDVETPSTSKYTNEPKKGFGGVKRILLPERDEEEDSKSRKERNFIDELSNVAKKIVLRRKRRVSVKRQEVTDNAHIYNFFSSMADLVSTLPYSTTLTAKARVTKILAEMVERVEKLQRNRSILTPITSYDIREEDLKLIKLRLSRLPYIY